MSKGNTISKSSTYTYDSSNSLLSTRTMPGGKTVQYTYDAYGNTTGVDFESGTIEWSLTGYNGRRTTSDIVLDNYSSPFKKAIVLDQYGHLDSLKITQTLQYGVIAYQNEKYIFDPIRGNLMQRQGVYEPNPITYTYDNADRLLTATMVHEYAHLNLDRYSVKGVFNEWIYTYDVTDDMNVPEHWYYDGPSGYPNEVFNAGKLHIGIVGNNHPVRDYWKITNGMKPYYLMPRRFNTQVVVKPFKF